MQPNPEQPESSRHSPTPPLPHSPTPRSGSFTIRKLLKLTTDYLAEKGIEPPRVYAEMLLAHVMRCKRLELYMYADKPVSDMERTALRNLVRRASENEPVDYLVGQTPFFSMMLKVDPRVLIPRPSTETLVEHVIQHARVMPGFKSPRIADVGTGSGCIAIALAKHIPGASIIATDISPDALAVAKENAAAQGVADRIDFRQGDMFEPLAGLRFHYLVSNPPYIPDDEWDDVEPNVKDFEPRGALRGGPEGMDLLGPMIADAPTFLEQPGQLAFEVAAAKMDLIMETANATPGLCDVNALHDHEGLPRIVVANRN